MRVTKATFEIVTPMFLGGATQNADSIRPPSVKVDAAIRWLKTEGYERVAADLTGGKVAMTIGGFIACEEAGCDSLYVACENDDKGRPLKKTARIVALSLSDSAVL